VRCRGRQHAILTKSTSSCFMLTLKSASTFLISASWLRRRAGHRSLNSFHGGLRKTELVRHQLDRHAAQRAAHGRCECGGHCPQNCRQILSLLQSFQIHCKKVQQTAAYADSSKKSGPKKHLCKKCLLLLSGCLPCCFRNCPSVRSISSHVLIP
jgi:hypothetical protein